MAQREVADVGPEQEAVAVVLPKVRTSLKMPDTHHCRAPLLAHTAPCPQAAGNLSSGPQ